MSDNFETMGQQVVQSTSFVFSQGIFCKKKKNRYKMQKINFSEI